MRSRWEWRRRVEVESKCFLWRWKINTKIIYLHIIGGDLVLQDMPIVRLWIARIRVLLFRPHWLIQSTWRDLILARSIHSGRFLLHCVVHIQMEFSLWSSADPLSCSLIPFQSSDIRSDNLETRIQFRQLLILILGWRKELPQSFGYYQGNPLSMVMGGRWWSSRM